MTGFDRVGGYRPYKQVEHTESTHMVRPIETRAKTNKLAAAPSNKRKSLKLMIVRKGSPKVKSRLARKPELNNATKTPELDPATKRGLTGDEYFSIIAHPEPKIVPPQKPPTPLEAPARNEATERMLLEIEHRNVEGGKMGPVRSEPLDAPARNEATERMLLEIENRDVDGEIEKLTQGLNDEEILSLVDPRIMDDFKRPDPGQAPKAAHWPEPTVHWPEQLEVPAMRNFNSVASETGDAIARAEAELRDQQRLQSAYDEAVREIVEQPQDKLMRPAERKVHMPPTEREVLDDYADFEKLLKQNEIEGRRDTNRDIDRELGTEEAGPVRPRAFYQEFERSIDPNRPRSQDQAGAARKIRPRRKKPALEQLFEPRPAVNANKRAPKTPGK
jgi:hypothetical protein